MSKKKLSTSRNIQEVLTSIQKSGTKKQSGQVMELLQEIQAKREQLKSKSKKKTKQVEPQVLKIVSMEPVKVKSQPVRDIPKLLFDNEVTESQSIQMLNRYKQSLARMQVKPKIGNELLEIATGLEAKIDELMRLYVDFCIQIDEFEEIKHN